MGYTERNGGKEKGTSHERHIGSPVLGFFDANVHIVLQRCLLHLNLQKNCLERSQNLVGCP